MTGQRSHPASRHPDRRTLLKRACGGCRWPTGISHAGKLLRAAADVVGAILRWPLPAPRGPASALPGTGEAVVRGAPPRLPSRTPNPDDPSATTTGSPPTASRPPAKASLSSTDSSAPPGTSPRPGGRPRPDRPGHRAGDVRRSRMNHVRNVYRSGQVRGRGPVINVRNEPQPGAAGARSRERVGQQSACLSAAGPTQIAIIVVRQASAAASARPAARAGCCSRRRRWGPCPGRAVAGCRGRRSWSGRGCCGPGRRG